MCCQAGINGHVLDIPALEWINPDATPLDGLELNVIGVAGASARNPAYLLIEHAGSDLQQLVGSHWGPPHLLLLFHKPLADNLVNRGFVEAGGNGLAVRVTARILRGQIIDSDNRQLEIRRTVRGYPPASWVTRAFKPESLVPFTLRAL